MITNPKIEYRQAQPYAAVRKQVSIPFGNVLGPLWGEVNTWLAGKGLTQSGAPFIRYITTDMARKLDIEVGWPVTSSVTGDEHITTGIFPAGKYAVLTYTGPYKGMGLVKATAALLDWAEKNHVRWQMTNINGVDSWEARLEHYITDPNEQPDSKKWQTELAFLIAD